MATPATQSSTAKIPAAAAAGNAWTRGSAVSAGGGRGLAPALKEPLRVIAHIDMDAFYAQIEQVLHKVDCLEGWENGPEMDEPSNTADTEWHTCCSRCIILYEAPCCCTPIGIL